MLGTLRLPAILLLSGDASAGAGTNIAISAASANESFSSLPYFASSNRVASSAAALGLATGDAVTPPIEIEPEPGL